MIRQITGRQLVDIYMNGFASGVATEVAGCSGCSMEVSDEQAQQMCATVRADPAAMEAVAREVAEILAGVDTGPRTVITGGCDVPEAGH